MLFCNLGALRRGLSLGSGPDEKVASDFTSVPDPSARRLRQRQTPVRGICNPFLMNWLRRFIAALGRAQASLALRSLLNEFYAAVLGAAVLGSVVGDGFVRALTYGTHVERIAA